MAELANRLELAADFQQRLDALNRKQAEDFRRLLDTPPDPRNVPSSFWERVRKENEQEAVAMLLLIFIASYNGHIGWQDGEVPETDSRRDGLAEKWSKRRAATLAKDINSRSMDLLNLAGKDWEMKRRAGDSIPQSSIDEVVTKIFGSERTEVIAGHETQLAMVEGGDSGVVHSGVKVTTYWAHSRVRPGGHSHAAKKPCPICTPMEGKPESQWGGLSIPAHPRCDCFKAYEDEDGFLIGTSIPGMIPGDIPGKTWKRRRP